MNEKSVLNMFSSFLYRPFLKSNDPNHFILRDEEDYLLVCLLPKDNFYIPMLENSPELFLKVANEFVNKNPRSLGVVLPCFYLLDCKLDEHSILGASDNIHYEELEASTNLSKILPVVMGMVSGLLLEGSSKDDLATKVKSLIKLLAEFAYFNRFVGVSPFSAYVGNVFNEVGSKLHIMLNDSRLKSYKHDLETALFAALSSCHVSIGDGDGKYFIPPVATFLTQTVHKELAEGVTPNSVMDVISFGKGMVPEKFMSMGSLNEPVTGVMGNLFIYPWLVLGAVNPLLIVPKTIAPKFLTSPEEIGEYLDGNKNKDTKVSDFSAGRFKNIWGGDSFLPTTTTTDIFVREVCTNAEGIYLAYDSPYAISPTSNDYGFFTYHQVRHLNRVFLKSLSNYLAEHRTNLVRFLLDGNGAPYAGSSNFAEFGWHKFSAAILGIKENVPVDITFVDGNGEGNGEGNGNGNGEGNGDGDGNGNGNGTDSKFYYKYRTTLGGHFVFSSSQHHRFVNADTLYLKVSLVEFIKLLVKTYEIPKVNVTFRFLNDDSFPVLLPTIKEVFSDIKEIDGVPVVVTMKFNEDYIRCPMHHLDSDNSICISEPIEKCNLCVLNGGSSTPLTYELNKGWAKFEDYYNQYINATGAESV